MADLGAFVSLPTEAVSNVGHMWVGSLSLLGKRQYCNLKRNTNSGLISWKLNFPFGWARNNWEWGPKVRRHHWEAGRRVALCVCLRKPHIMQGTRRVPQVLVRRAVSQTTQQPNGGCMLGVLLVVGQAKHLP